MCAYDEVRAVRTGPAPRVVDRPSSSALRAPARTPRPREMSGGGGGEGARANEEANGGSRNGERDARRGTGARRRVVGGRDARSRGGGERTRARRASPWARRHTHTRGRGLGAHVCLGRDMTTSAPTTTVNQRFRRFHLAPLRRARGVRGVPGAAASLAMGIHSRRRGRRPEGSGSEVKAAAAGDARRPAPTGVQSLLPGSLRDSRVPAEAKTKGREHGLAHTPRRRPRESPERRRRGGVRARVS